WRADGYQRALVPELDNAGERSSGGLGIAATGLRHPELRGALSGEVSQAALGLGRGNLGEHVGGGDPFDREPAHGDVAVGSGNLDQDGSIVLGQSPDGFAAHADVAV